MVTPVDVILDGGCADNKLTIVDDTPAADNSSLQYPGLSASCSQSTIAVRLVQQLIGLIKLSIQVIVFV